MSAPERSEKMRAFCDAYVRTGNATESARIAGYKHPQFYGFQLLKKPWVQAEVKRLGELLQQESDRATVADAQEVLEFHTATMRDKEQPMIARQRAAQLLARILGLETENHNVNVRGVMGVVILPSNGREPDVIDVKPEED